MKNEIEMSDSAKGTGGSVGDPKEVMDGSNSLSDWTSEPSVLDLKNDLEACKVLHDNHTANVKRWNDIRNVTNAKRPKKVTGRSQIQPKLVRRQNEWRYSALAEPFLSSQKIFDVEPHTWEDEHAAKQNELTLNWQFRTKFNKVKFIDEYVRTAVDEGTVIVKLGWERETEDIIVEEPVYQFIPITDAQQAEPLKQALDLRQQNPREYHKLPDEMKASVEYFDENGIPAIAQQLIEDGLPVVDEVEDVRILRNQPVLDIIDPENFHIDPACNGDPDKAKFMVYTYETTKADLKKDSRYKNLDKVTWSTNTTTTTPDHETPEDKTNYVPDELRTPVVVYEYWGWYDVNGDETLVPIVASWIGNTMIRMEKNPFPDEKPPFVIVPYLPIKRSVFGEPDAELIEDNQDVLGALIRGLIDLMARSANSQTGTAKGFLDVSNQRRFDKGEDYQFNPGSGDPRLAVYQHQYPEIPNSAIQMIGMQNQEAESISGVKAFSGGLSAETYGEVAAGIKGMLDASAKREMNILRRLAKGMIDIGKKVAAMNSIFLSEEEVIRVTNNEYVTIEREDLKGGFDLIVDINTAEIDAAKAEDLGFMLQTIGPNMDFRLVNNILAQIAELKRMPALAQELRSYEPKPDPMAEKMRELEMRKLEAEVMEIEAQAQERVAKAQKLQAETDQANLDFVEQETGTAHARDMQRLEAQAESNQDLRVTDALLTPRKEGESNPSVDAAIGWNALTKGRGLS